MFSRRERGTEKERKSRSLFWGEGQVVDSAAQVTVAAASTIARVTPTKEDRARCGDKLSEDLVELESGAKASLRLSYITNMCMFTPEQSDLVASVVLARSLGFFILFG